MNIFVQLRRQDHFSHNEKMIAQYILEHPEDVLKMNSKQLSEHCFVSVATIYRLCDKLKLNGFSALKVSLSRSIKDYLNANEDFDFNFPVLKYQTHFEVIENLKEDYLETMNTTADLFALDQLKDAVFALKRATCIDIYTSAGSIYFAQNFKFQMQEIGKDVHVPLDEYEQRLTSAASDQNHLAIVISFGGRGLLMDILPPILRRNKTPILLISSLEYTFKDQEPDYHLYMSSHENHYHKISSYSTRLSTLYILDVLYTCYFKLDYDENMKRKLYYYDCINPTHQ